MLLFFGMSMYKIGLSTACVLAASMMMAVGCIEVENHSPKNTLGSIEQPESTQKMVAQLDSLHRITVQYPQAYYYMNQKHAELMEAQLPNERSFSFQKTYASALLNGGYTEKAIEQLKRLQASTGNNGYTTRTGKALWELLGISYLRLGEQQNCVTNHTPASCILPLEPKAFHRLQNGSRNALQTYTDLLGRYQNDYQSRWLLNVAYMTLGAYPGEVPAKVLIPGLEARKEVSVSRFRNVWDYVAPSYEELSGGVAIDDFTGDGLLDIFTSGYRLNDPIHFYVNDGNGGFSEQHIAAGLEGLSGGLNMLHADYNNDGHLDLLILRGAWLGEAGQHPNSLLRNNGDGTFEDVTVSAGVYSLHPTQTAAWGDYNLDGFLDLFVGNEESDQWLGAWQSASGLHAFEDRTHRSELFQNNGDGTFTEVAVESGIDLDAFVKGVTWGDVNNDGLPDLYVSIIGSPNRLYLNRGPHEELGWRFEEISAGVHEPFFSFPTWFFDYDNDGWQDLFVGAYDLRRIDNVAEDVAREYLGVPTVTERPRLYHNNRDETFSDVTRESGLDKVLFSMGSNFGDLDNDGYLDFYVGTGAPDLKSIVPNRMFYNNEGNRYEEITFEGGFGHLQKGHAVAFADLDQDGDQDVYASIGGAYEGDVYRNVLFENPGMSTRNSWVTLRLKGSESNRDGIGARIKVVVSDADGHQRALYRTVSTGGSFGASSLQQEIGLGQAIKIDEIEVRWPNREGKKEAFLDLAVNQYYTLTEGTGTVEPAQEQAIPFRTHTEDAHP